MEAKRRSAGLRSAMVLALALMGCFTWRPYEPSVPLGQSANLPYRLRATLGDSTKVELTSPFVRADTLFGRSGPERDTVAMSLTEVRGFERERFNLWRTFGVTVVAPIAALLAVFAIVCEDGDCGAQPTY